MSDLYEAQRDVYDRVHAAIKQYPKEVDRLLKRVRGSIGRDPESWLDVGCGTGHHLEALHAAGVGRLVGVDLSEAQIDGARARLAGLPIDLRVGDMRTLDVPADGGFHVVSSLFSGVGHLHDDADYERTLERMAAHLHPKGVVIVEPWIAAADYRPGRVDADVVEDDRGKIVRITKHALDGDVAVLEFRFVVTTDSEEILDWTTEFRLRLRDVDEQRAMFERVFAHVEFQSTGSGSRGVFLARKRRS